MHSIRFLSVFLLLGALLIAPFAHGMLWEDFDIKHTYSSDGWFKLNVNIEHAHFATSQSGLAIWNSSLVYVLGINKTFKFNNLDNVWVGKYYISVYSGNQLVFINISSDKKLSFHLNAVQNVILAGFGAAIVSKNNVYILNFETGTLVKRPYAIYAATDLHNHEFLFYSSHMLFGYGPNSTWNVSFPSKIIDVAVGNDCYVLAGETVYSLSNAHVIKSLFKFSAYALYILNNYPLLITYAEDDEGGRYWIFTFMVEVHGNYTTLKEAMTYKAPKGIVNQGRYLTFYDSYYVHFLDLHHNLCTNNTFEHIYIGGDYVVGIKSGSIYALNLNRVAITLKDLGYDNNLNWTSNRNGSKDDNNGMPDWGEENFNMIVVDYLIISLFVVLAGLGGSGKKIKE